MSTPSMATPSRGGPMGGGGMDTEIRTTCTYICGECHVEQEIKPKVVVNFSTIGPIITVLRIPFVAASVATEFSTRNERAD